MMIDILLPAFMVFMSGCLFGLFTAMIVDWYYEKKKKEVEDAKDSDRNIKRRT